MPSSVPIASLLLGDGARAVGQGPDLTRYLLVCALLVALVAGLGWGLRRLLGRSLKVRAARRSLQVVDLLPMGRRQRLAVVRCYDRTFLLGVGEREVSLVAELDPVLATEPAPAEADRSAFARALESLRGTPGPRKSRVQAGKDALQPGGILG
jgi:flagellar biosynthetic protein FliO